MKWMGGGVTAARGFRAAGFTAGIKPSRRPDLALVLADRPVTAVGVFTRNRIQAAPVQLSRQRLRTGTARAVFINSGCANCLTGVAGLRDARTLSRSVARALGLPDRAVLVASTGIIGTRIPVAKVQRAIPTLVKRLSRRDHRAAATGILTTDRVPKEAAVSSRIGGRIVHVGGMAKGAGMIAPSMATMLCVLTTDAAASPAVLRGILRQAVAASFNQISVDDDMSTNDTVFALASGHSGVRIRPGGVAYQTVARMVQAVTRRLALAIVEDGEGATRVAEIRVVGARTDAQAQRCARQVAGSSLVKTMLAGGDPNVGRIAAAVGASGVLFRPQRLEISLNGHRLVAHGRAVPIAPRLSRTLLAGRPPRPAFRGDPDGRRFTGRPPRPAFRGDPDGRRFTGRRVDIRIHLRAGRGTGRMLSTDLTEAYVRINARYIT